MWEFWGSRLSKGKTRHRRRAGSDDDGSLSPMTSRSNLAKRALLSPLFSVPPVQVWYGSMLEYLRLYEPIAGLLRHV